jgi:hypothetical protein
VFAAQPFAIEQMGAGQLHPHASTREAVDRFCEEVFGYLTIAYQGSRACFDPERPVRRAGPCCLGQSLACTGGERGHSAPAGGFDQLR